MNGFVQQKDDEMIECPIAVALSENPDLIGERHRTVENLMVVWRLGYSGDDVAPHHFELFSWWEMTAHNAGYSRGLSEWLR